VADDERFGVDIYVPIDEDEVLRPTPTGDLPVIRGRANLSHALAANVITTPGELIHRPGYGGGLAQDVETPATPGALARSANRLRAALLLDARLAGRDVRVSVTPGLPSDPGRAGTVTASISAVPHGDTAPTVVTVTE